MYRISNNTLVILPYYDLTYQSKVIEKDKKVFITEAPLRVIRENCLHYGSSYEGRKQSVTYHLGYTQKLPIPIHPATLIYAFPTQSPVSYDCIWLFYQGIRGIRPLETNSKTAIQFINGTEFILAQSYHTIHTQFERTGMCKVIFDQLK
ncbi:competence protein ComK [Gracilibacillus xinjiangensis]|uniref:Competence protein ComK n=1 Tax=Gracilibacillus xinjiangensis TaxID=1193282 RepID=A0ABV8WVB8_9BACI